MSPTDMPYTPANGTAMAPKFVSGRLTANTTAHAPARPFSPPDSDLINPGAWKTPTWSGGQRSLRSPATLRRPP
jgi:hypothetical protein